MTRGLTSGEPVTPKGRGARLNPANRFEGLSLKVLPEQPASNTCQIPTRVYHDATRQVINRVDSPDLGFHWTINPYRGCETGCVSANQVSPRF